MLIDRHFHFFRVCKSQTSYCLCWVATWWEDCVGSSLPLLFLWSESYLLACEHYCRWGFPHISHVRLQLYGICVVLWDRHPFLHVKMPPEDVVLAKQVFSVLNMPNPNRINCTQVSVLLSLQCPIVEFVFNCTLEKIFPYVYLVLPASHLLTDPWGLPWDSG